MSQTFWWNDKSDPNFDDGDYYFESGLDVGGLDWYSDPYAGSGINLGEPTFMSNYYEIDWGSGGNSYEIDWGTGLSADDFSNQVWGSGAGSNVSWDYYSGVTDFGSLVGDIANDDYWNNYYSEVAANPYDFSLFDPEDTLIGPDPVYSDLPQNDPGGDEGNFLKGIADKGWALLQSLISGTMTAGMGPVQPRPTGEESPAPVQWGPGGPRATGQPGGGLGGGVLPLVVIGALVLLS